MATDDGGREGAIEVTDAAAFERATDVDGFVLVEFRAPWSERCRAAEEALGRAARRDGFRAVLVDVERCPGVAYEFGVDRLPTIVLLDDGEPAGRTVGEPEPDRLLESLRERSSTDTRR